MQSNKITEISLIRKISFLGINKLGTWNLKLETWNLELETWNLKLGT